MQSRRLVQYPSEEAYNKYFETLFSGPLYLAF